MKTLAMLTLVAGAAVLCGCESDLTPGYHMGDTPAYSQAERSAQIQRNMVFDWEQIADDTDHLLLLRPSGQLTEWNIYHHD
jgi:hypothetical protein